MELVQHGSLQQYVGDGLPEAEVKLILTQILQGVAYMHQAGYAHRDLKPQNLLVVQKGPMWQIKIADFGLSKRVFEDLTSFRTAAGTPAYMAPELQSIRAQSGYHDKDRASDSDDSADDLTPSYTNAVDIWAIGIISFLLLTGNVPSFARSYNLLARYARGKASFPREHLETKAVNASACELIEQLLAPTPGGRPSAESCLRHPWLGHAQAGISLTSSKKPVEPSASGSKTASGSESPTRSGSWNTVNIECQSSRTLRSEALPQMIENLDFPVRPPMALRQRYVLYADLQSGNVGEYFALSSCGTFLATLQWGQVTIWNTAEGMILDTIGKRYEKRIPNISLSFSPDGKHFAFLIVPRDDSNGTLDLGELAIHESATGSVIVNCKNPNVGRKLLYSRSGELMGLKCRDETNSAYIKRLTWNFLDPETGSVIRESQEMHAFAKNGNVKALSSAYGDLLVAEYAGERASTLWNEPTAASCGL